MKIATSSFQINFLFKLVSTLLLSVSLIACGDDDDSAGSGGSGGGSSSAPITKSNYTSTASRGVGLIELVGPIVSLTSRAENFAALSKVDPFSYATNAESAACSSGSGSITSNFDDPYTASEGDRFSATYNYCRDIYPNGSFSVLNGGISYVYHKIVGDYFFDDSAYVLFNGLYKNFSLTTRVVPPEHTRTASLDGDVTIELEKAATTTSERTKIRALNLSFGELDADDEETVTVTNFLFEGIEDFSNGTYTISGSYDAIISPDFSGSFSVMIDPPLQRLEGNAYASSGVITINDNNSSAVVVTTILSEALVRIEYDENGDGIPEDTSELTHQELEDF